MLLGDRGNTTSGYYGLRTHTPHCRALFPVVSKFQRNGCARQECFDTWRLNFGFWGRRPRKNSATKRRGRQKKRGDEACGKLKNNVYLPASLVVLLVFFLSMFLGKYFPLYSTSSTYLHNLISTIVNELLTQSSQQQSSRFYDATELHPSCFPALLRESDRKLITQKPRNSLHLNLLQMFLEIKMLLRCHDLCREVKWNSSRSRPEAMFRKEMTTEKTLFSHLWGDLFINKTWL